MGSIGTAPSVNRRILIVDDNPAIHDDFRKILVKSNDCVELDEDEAAIFGQQPDVGNSIGFEIESAFQGQEGLQKVDEAGKQGKPYAVAFVDVRMPPGWDGVETISRIWQVCPELQIVICTAYSDYSWEEIFRQVGQNDSLLILKKPFDNVEVLQMAHAMTRKWALNQQARDHMGQLNRLVQERTIELRDANEGLVRMNRQLESAVERAKKNARDAEAANRSKDLLLSELGRELRGSIGATVRLTRQLIETSLTEKQRHHVEAVRLHCDALSKFASRALDIAQVEIEGSSGEEAEFDIRELVEQLRELHRGAANSKSIEIGISCSASIPGRLVGDTLRFRHALSNLIEASIRQHSDTKLLIDVQIVEAAIDVAQLRIVIGCHDAVKSSVIPDIGVVDADKDKINALLLDESGTHAITRRLVDELGGKYGSQHATGDQTVYWLVTRFRKPSSPAVADKAA